MDSNHWPLPRQGSITLCRRFLEFAKSLQIAIFGERTVFPRFQNLHSGCCTVAAHSARSAAVTTSCTNPATNSLTLIGSRVEYSSTNLFTKFLSLPLSLWSRSLTAMRFRFLLALVLLRIVPVNVLVSIGSSAGASRISPNRTNLKHKKTGAVFGPGSPHVRLVKAVVANRAAKPKELAPTSRLA